MMTHGGLSKLVEEIGELSQVAGKMLQYPDQDDHPDGQGSLIKRLEDEIADVSAALQYVIRRKDLNTLRILNRAQEKVILFEQWGKEP